MNIFDYFDDVLKVSVCKYVRLVIVDYVFRDMWLFFSELNVFFVMVVDLMVVLKV